AKRPPLGNKLYLGDERIPGYHRLSELGILYTAYHGYLVFVDWHRKHQDASDLGHGFQNQHARHHRLSGKVAVKEVLVNGDVLQADRALSGLDLKDSVHEEHRVAVRQERAYLFNIQHGQPP